MMVMTVARDNGPKVVLAVSNKPKQCQDAKPHSHMLAKIECQAWSIHWRALQHLYKIWQSPILSFPTSTIFPLDRI